MDRQFETDLISAQKTLQGYAWTLMRNHDHAGDLVQDTNLLAWSKRGLSRTQTANPAPFSLTRAQQIEGVCLDG
jgi:DNA-directed RNA polymerase specialized sigma24 family protein